MQLQFDAGLSHQRQAVDAVCSLFAHPRQEAGGGVFSVDTTVPSDYMISDTVVGNEMVLTPEEVLANLQEVQEDQGLPVAERLESPDFTVEMETGTGKTYVYLRTAYELNRRFGFTKFIVVVPSIAIREGVYKSLQIMSAHFASLYGGLRPEYFVYDSAKLGRVRAFANSNRMQIMVVTVGAINRQTARLYQEDERTDDLAPIDLIRKVRPVLIVDEPQSVDGGREGAGRRALRDMEPLCTLRYSATHVDKHHMVYKLDPIDAYQRGLVKQIEVAAATVEDSHNQPSVRFVRLLPGAEVKAQVEVSIAGRDRARTERTTVIEDDDLEQVTGLTVYRGHRIGVIAAAAGQESLEVVRPDGPTFLALGESTATGDGSAVQHQMIRRTIREHLDKELVLRPLGIKVLSLFFIDAVERYRVYKDDGTYSGGEYAQFFEQEYERAVRHPKYAGLFGGLDVDTDPSLVHAGYFSLDRKRRWIDTAEGNDSGRQAAEEAYKLIMQDKERLLSLSEPLKFIFSHSALREGWDNPNVFQICTLRPMSTDRERRQTIGRGLRLAVDQNGSRVHNQPNVLTVVANESYEDFARGLQRDIEADTGILFGVIDPDMFAGLRLPQPGGDLVPMGEAERKRLVEALADRQYVDNFGKVLPPLRTALDAGHVVLPAEFEPQRARITALLRKRIEGIRIDDANAKVTVRVRPEVLASPEFQALWPRIRRRTVYRVDFDIDRLVEDCAAALRRAPRVPAATLHWKTVEVGIDRGGVRTDLVTGGSSVVAIDEGVVPIPDFLTELAERTSLTRRTLARILAEGAMWAELRRNPRAFIDHAVAVINDRKRQAITGGIRYRPLNEGEDYLQEQFERDELTTHADRALPTSDKCVYDHVIVESRPERAFVADLETDEAFTLFTKLPRWFSVPTPLGPYHPDWGVVVKKEGADGRTREHLYLVAETKSTTLEGRLRPEELTKARCGQAHFEALEIDETSARFKMVTRASELLEG